MTDSDYSLNHWIKWCKSNLLSNGYCQTVVSASSETRLNLKKKRFHVYIRLPNCWRHKTWLFYPFAFLLFFLSLTHTDIILHIKACDWNVAASRSHKALLYDLPLNQLEVYSHYSSPALCLQQSVKKRNKRVELRGLTYRELTFSSS